MFIKLSVFFILIKLALSFPKIPIGFIVRKEDEYLEKVFQHGLRTQQDILPERQPLFLIDIQKIIVREYDAFNYHQAVCSLLSRGIMGLITSHSPPFPLTTAYSNAFRIALITPDLLVEPTYSHYAPDFGIGIQPSTMRVILSIIQIYGWKDVVYLYDHDYGPEILQQMFILGYNVLKIKLTGVSRVASAEDANNCLRKLDTLRKREIFHVILDTNPTLARDILIRHVHDIHVRKKNFHFLLSQPTLEEFWTSQKTEIGSLNVTGILAIPPNSQHLWRTEEYYLNTTSYYCYDAALVLLKALGKLVMDFSTSHLNAPLQNESRNCLANEPNPISNGARLAELLKEVNIKDALTNNIEFDSHGLRKRFDLSIVKSSFSGYRIFGNWTSGVLRTTSLPSQENYTFLPQVQNDQRLQITTILSPPFMMLKKNDHGNNLTGNDRFEGYCKDMIDLIAKELKFEYELKLVEDNSYGRFEKQTGKWTGLIGEIIQGKADVAVANLIVTGQRQRVVDFTDPFETVGFSLVMKNPHSVLATSSIFFFLTAFSVDVWICILVSVIMFSVLFHFITKFTGAPDSIESVSGFWGRKNTIIISVWFSIGSSMMQGTGVYPRSISSRILSGAWWFSTLVLSSLFIASMTAQLRADTPLQENSPQVAQLKALTMETIISESISRGWPRIGVIHPSHASIFIKKSTIPIFMQYADFLNNNPDVQVSDVEEGLKRVRKSSGDFMLLVESLTSTYFTRQKPCDILATYDSVNYAGYGIAVPLGSPLKSSFNTALINIQRRGFLGHLHRKWWIDSTQCRDDAEKNKSEINLHSFSGLLCISVAGFIVLLVISGIQYLRKTESRESRRQQLSFEDMTLNHASLPTPPPELLAEPPPMLNMPEYDRSTLL